MSGEQRDAQSGSKWRYEFCSTNNRWRKEKKKKQERKKKKEKK